MTDHNTAAAPEPTLTDIAHTLLRERITHWEAPQDRASATKSEYGDIEYVEDLIRPGRIITVAAEEGTGKTFAFQGELGIRLALGIGSFAETWPIRTSGPVLFLSEMPEDEDFDREEMILESLGHTRSDLAGKYYRQNLHTAAGGVPVLDSPEYIAELIDWINENGIIVLMLDTASNATDSEAWGAPMRQVMRNLRRVQASCPQLAILLVVHMKKPSGARGAPSIRGLDAVMGEWGRFNDVTVLMMNDGGDLTRVRLATRKRVRHQRHLILTKRGGLLVEPMDLETAAKPQKKVSDEGQLAIIEDRPGITILQFASSLGVTKNTAKNYSESLEKANLIRREKQTNGTYHLYPVDTDSAPESAPLDEPTSIRWYEA